MSGQTMKAILLTAATLLALGACRPDEVSLPEAVTMTEEAVGHYCQMEILEHGGPKAQVHLEGFEAPVWFAQVRDVVAYLRMPERQAEVVAVYVNDMAVAVDWESPGSDNWILAEEAVYVVGSSARGGMGAPEVVPFGSRESAEAFAAEQGGQVMDLAEIPDSSVFGEVEIEGYDS